MTRLRKTAVVTTFSRAGWDLYAERMVLSWVKHWPQGVDLYLYPDEKVPLSTDPRVRGVYDRMEEKDTFLSLYASTDAYTGAMASGYDYRFDAVKFCHKPFCIQNLMRKSEDGLTPYEALIWLDADTLTHNPVSPDALSEMTPAEYDVMFLGRCYKYTECGFLYFNLTRKPARDLIDNWTSYYTEGTFRKEREYHDSYLFDRAKEKMGDELQGKDLTGHLPKRSGAGHPLINSFLGEYLDHLKGDARKITGKPRKNDLFIDHKSDYWKANSHAKDKRRPINSNWKSTPS